MHHGAQRARWILSNRMLVFLLLWLTLGSQTILAAPEPVGRVEWFEGKVVVEREGYSGSAVVGDPVFLHDKWQTEANTGAELVFLDQSRIRMGPAASLEITEYVYQPQDKSRNSLISMMSGKVRYVVQDLQDYKEKRFRVQTQTAIVGTRGTEFIVWIDSPCGPAVPLKDCLSPPVTKVLAISNEITFANVSFPGNPVTLAPGMTSQTHTNVLPTPPAVAPPEVRQEIMKGTEPAPVSSDTQAGAQPSQSKPATTTTTTSSSGGVYQEVQKEDEKAAASDKTQSVEQAGETKPTTSDTADEGSKEVKAAGQAAYTTEEAQTAEKSLPSEETQATSAAMEDLAKIEEAREDSAAPVTQALLQATQPMVMPPPPPPEVPTVIGDTYDPTASTSTGR